MQMPRYFFDTTDAGQVTRDDVGIELPDDEAARKYVGVILPDLAHRGMPDGDAHVFSCTARREDGDKVYRADLRYQGSVIPEAGQGDPGA